MKKYNLTALAANEAYTGSDFKGYFSLPEVGGSCVKNIKEVYDAMKKQIKTFILGAIGKSLVAIGKANKDLDTVAEDLDNAATNTASAARLLLTAINGGFPIAPE